MVAAMALASTEEKRMVSEAVCSLRSVVKTVQEIERKTGALPLVHEDEV